jgi:hypothetical protein
MTNIPALDRAVRDVLEAYMSPLWPMSLTGPATICGEPVKGTMIDFIRTRYWQIVNEK